MSVGRAPAKTTALGGRDNKESIRIFIAASQTRQHGTTSRRFALRSAHAEGAIVFHT